MGYIIWGGKNEMFDYLPVSSLHYPDQDNLKRIMEESGFELLPITPSHILTSSKLEFYHRDPFDRIIIGQAINENLGIMTKDGQFRNYPVELIWEK